MFDLRKLVPVSKRKIEFTKPNVNSGKTSKPNQNRTPAKPSQIKKSTKEIGTNLPVNPIKPTKEPNQKTSKLKPNPRPFKPNQEEKFSKISPFSRNGRIPENKNRERKNFYLLYLHLFFLFSFDSRVCMFCFVINFSLKCLKPIFFSIKLTFYEGSVLDFIFQIINFVFLAMQIIGVKIYNIIDITHTVSPTKQNFKNANNSSQYRKFQPVICLKPDIQCSVWNFLLCNMHYQIKTGKIPSLTFF